MNAADIAGALNGRPTRRGWRARCPAHDDRHPSLDISETTEGRVLVHCWSGCSQAEVIEALRERGLWSPSKEFGWPPTQAQRQSRFEILCEVIRSQPKLPPPPECCLKGPPFDCEHRRQFNRLWALGELHKNLVEACRELVSKIERTGRPITREILRKGIEFAIPFGTIVPTEITDDAIVAKAIDFVLAEFDSEVRAA